MAFEIKDLLVTIRINAGRDHAQLILAGDQADPFLADIVACGRTNHPDNALDPAAAFVGRLDSDMSLNALRDSLSDVLVKLGGPSAQKLAELSKVSQVDSGVNIPPKKAD